MVDGRKCRQTSNVIAAGTGDGATRPASPRPIMVSVDQADTVLPMPSCIEIIEAGAATVRVGCTTRLPPAVAARRVTAGGLHAADGGRVRQIVRPLREGAASRVASR